MNEQHVTRETRTVEFKEQISDSFLKSVSAFANYSGGKVYFGITDDRKTVGIKNPEDELLTIENKINSTIKPQPNYQLDLTDDNVIVLTVKEGLFKPYKYRGKAFKRADTSTVEVDHLELNRLTLVGSGIDYEALPAQVQELKFSVLEEEFVEKHSIKELSPDILKTLQLLSPDGVYNKAAELLADTNDFPGIDMARFGSTINEIHGRYDLTGVSVLKQFHEALNIFNQNYVYEKIEGAARETVETIPKEAFRESIANALVHRAWDVRAPIKVSMHPDKIVVTSPGGLPPGVSPHDYVNGHFSLLRNPILGMVFFRLGYIEKFGTGIARIKHLYQASVVQPAFDIYDSSITITLPILSDEHSLNQHHVKVLAALDNATPRSRSEIATVAAVSRAITIRALNELIELGSVKKVGSGPQTKYMRNN